MLLTTALAQAAQEAAQIAQEGDATNKWITFGLILAPIPVLNWGAWFKNKEAGPVVKVLTVALGVGAFGILLTIFNISWINDFEKEVASWMKFTQGSSIAPWVFLIVALTIRLAQAIQTDGGVIKKILDATPNFIEVILMIIFGGLAGLAMAGVPAWESWFDGWGELVKDVVEQLKLTIDLSPF